MDISDLISQSNKQVKKFHADGKDYTFDVANKSLTAPAPKKDFPDLTTTSPKIAKVVPSVASSRD